MSEEFEANAPDIAVWFVMRGHALSRTASKEGRGRWYFQDCPALRESLVVWKERQAEARLLRRFIDARAGLLLALRNLEPQVSP